MQNAYKNFEGYCHLFQHIYMLCYVILMFFIDSCGFSIDLLYLICNYAEQETPVLHIFMFQGLFGSQAELRFL
jgi:hypothetical protein